MILSPLFMFFILSTFLLRLGPIFPSHPKPFPCPSQFQGPPFYFLCVLGDRVDVTLPGIMKLTFNVLPISLEIEKLGEKQMRS